MMQALDIYTLPLSGLRLIEASAGTGKTWTIAALYLRLLLEKDGDVETMLVLTFTKAATAELRTRIRERISEVRQALLSGESEDAFCQWALQRWQGEERAAAVQKLGLARRAMDQAAIFTIHGFCQRALGELQVPALLNEPEVTADELALLPALVQEAWIRHCRSQLLATLLAGSSLSSELVQGDIAILLRKPYIHLVPSPASSEKELLQQWQALQDAWGRHKADILKDVLEADALGRAKDSYKDLDDLLGLLAAAMEAGAGQGIAGVLRRLTPARFATGRKIKGRLPQHAFWDAMANFWQGADALLEQFRRTLIKDVLAALNTTKAREGQISYQDLLVLLEERLHDAALAASLRASYPMALIDEFQDTDPLQFSIFHRMYEGADNPVFLVGDPKQAIYSFRGADIFTYLEARRLALELYTLGSNRRSVPGLVAAVNTLFGRQENSFLLRDLPYQPVAAAAQLPAFSADDKQESMVCWLLPEQDGGKALSKEAAGDLSVAACAGEIARLLNAGQEGRAGMGEVPLAPANIAVLVSTHRQGRMVRDALAERGVAAVLRATESVFVSLEAVAMRRVLEAVAEPGNDGLLKAALLSDFMGESLHDIAALQQDDSRWAELTTGLLELRELWQHHGFMAMWETLLERFQVFERLLAGGDGERRLTNLRHLAVLMQEKADTEPSLWRQLIWLREKLDSADGSEEALLRLESDSARVQILTVHVSKGLEFPVVFCPFLWDGALLQKQEQGRAEYHDDTRAMLDLGSNDLPRALQLMSGERLAEKLRLLYVALTRAKFRCYLSWGPVRDMETAALTWLLLGKGILPTPKSLKDDLKEKATLAHCRDALAAVAGAEQGISWCTVPADASVYRAARQRSGKLVLATVERHVHRSWTVSSFSGLTATAHEQETPDHDTAPQENTLLELPPEPEALQGIHAFPRGAQAGVFWHELLENRIAGRIDDRKKFIATCLQKYALDSEWAGLVDEQLELFMRSRLDADGLRLDRLEGAVVEMEFTYPVHELSPEKLRQLASLPEVAPAYRQALASLDFSRRQGFLKGFIDLICRHRGRYYVIDYKTNWLGPTTADYTFDAMQRSVAESHYYLQYWLYTLALHRYLRSVKPDYDYDRDVAGVRYLYLRGITENGENGVYCSRPSRALVEALDALMEGQA